jgi:hypothetical protein
LLGLFGLIALSVVIVTAGAGLGILVVACVPDVPVLAGRGLFFGATLGFLAAGVLWKRFLTYYRYRTDLTPIEDSDQDR